MKIAHQLALILVTAVVAVIGVSGAFWVWRESRLYESAANEQLITMGRTIRPAVVHTWNTQGRRAALGLLEYADERFQLRRNVTIRWVRLDAPKGDAEAPVAPPSRLEPLRSGAPVATTLDAERLVYVPVEVAGTAGALELSRPAALDEQFVGRATTAVAMEAAGVALILIVVVLVGVNHSVGRPLRELASQARRVAEGDLTVRVRLRPNSDAAAVADEMNQMCERLLESKEQVQAEHEARLATLEQLRHADRLATVGKLAAGIAHELGTPLNVVTERAKLIAKGDHRGEGAAASARIIATQGERMARIIRQLLGFARRRVEPRVRTDIEPVVRQTLDLLTPMAQKSGIDLRLAEPVASAQVLIEVNQLQQALANLIVNGIQATPRGGSVRVAIREEQALPPRGLDEREGAYVRMEVVDQGQGISEDTLPHVFDPFFTTKPVGEGTGLGLSVAYGIAREHGGWIDVATQRGAGCTFAVHVPVAPPTSDTYAS